MHSGDAEYINFIVVCFDPIGLEHTIYHTHGEHTNYYTTDAVHIFYEKLTSALTFIRWEETSLASSLQPSNIRVSKLCVTLPAVDPDTTGPMERGVTPSVFCTAINVRSFPNCMITHLSIASLAASISII